MLLHDWNDGRIAYYTLPPARPDHGHASAAVVPAWGAEFNADEARWHAMHACVPAYGSVAALMSSAALFPVLGSGGADMKSIQKCSHLAREDSRVLAAGRLCHVIKLWLRGFCAAQAFAAEQSAVIAGLPSLQEGGFFETAPAGEATVDLAAAAADAGGPWGQPFSAVLGLLSCMPCMRQLMQVGPWDRHASAVLSFLSCMPRMGSLIALTWLDAGFSCLG
jgi:hypothetical protein